jgi:hypothetical protein
MRDVVSVVGGEIDEERASPPPREVPPPTDFPVTVLLARANGLPKPARIPPPGEPVPIVLFPCTVLLATVNGLSRLA